MVTRPELVVYPHVPSDASGSSSDNGSESDSGEYKNDSKAKRRGKNKLRKSSDQYHKAKEKEEKKRRRRDRRGKKTTKINIGPPKGIGVGVERKAMVAGAVVVLGIAMAVYGAKNGQQISPPSPLAPPSGVGTGFRGLLKGASGVLDYFTH